MEHVRRFPGDGPCTRSVPAPRRTLDRLGDTALLCSPLPVLAQQVVDEVQAGAELKLGQRWGMWGGMTVQHGEHGYRNVVDQVGMRMDW